MAGDARGTAQGSSKLCKACPEARSCMPSLFGRVGEVAGACMHGGMSTARSQGGPGFVASPTRRPRCGSIPVACAPGRRIPRSRPAPS